MLALGIAASFSASGNAKQSIVGQNQEPGHLLQCAGRMPARSSVHQ